MSFLVAFLSAGLFTGDLHAKTYSVPEIRRLVAARGGVSAASKDAGPHAWKALQVILDNGFEFQPWFFEKAAEIRTEHGLRAVSILAEKYTEISEGVLQYCAEIDNAYALKAFEALTEKHSVLYSWEVRWAAEVHTGREYAAYQRVVAARHTERAVAQAALLDGLKSGAFDTASLESRRKARSFQVMVRQAVAGLPKSCRMRLSGAELSVREWHEQGVADDVVVRYSPGLVESSPHMCSQSRPAKMVLYSGPFRDFHDDGGPEVLRGLIMKKIGCRPVHRVVRREALVAARYIGGIGGDLRDAVASRKPKSPSRGRSRKPACPVRRFQEPRIVVVGLRSGRKTDTAGLITADMERNVNAPSRPSAAAGGGPEPR